MVLVDFKGKGFASRWKLLFHSDSKHIERCVTPCILWIKQTSADDGVKVEGRAITLGWWKWGLSLANFRLEDEEERTIF